MKRMLLAASASAILLSIGLGHSPQVLADESANVEIKLTAPVDATNCSATPATITVLGLNIDVSNLSAEGGGSPGGTPTPGQDGGGSGITGCAALQVGQSVELTLSSDTPDANGNLDATQAEQSGDSEIKLEAPLQAADANGDAVDANGNVQVLGLTVNINNANMDGLDDDGNPDPSPTATPGPSSLTVGQFVSMKVTNNGACDTGSGTCTTGTLKSGLTTCASDSDCVAALNATELEVKAFTNGVDVEIDDTTGTPAPGADDDEVDIEVDDTVVVQATPTPATGAAAVRPLRPRKVRKVVTFHLQTTTRHVTLNGLPSGKAAIKVTRTLNGTAGRRTVVIRKNLTRSVRIRLHM